MKPQRTPGPWRIGNRINLVVGPNGGSIANCEFTHSDSKQAVKPSPDECEANAAFIVRAVNSHDELVELLIAIRDMAAESAWYPTEAKLIERVDAAIQKTGEA